MTPVGQRARAKAVALVESIERRTNENPWHVGRPRANDCRARRSRRRSSGSSRSCRRSALSPPTTPASGPVRTATSSTAGRSRPRRRPTCRRTRSTRWASSEVQRLHAQMDAILKEVGYAEGSVGERMKALAKDPRYKFSEGDKGRAEIMAFIKDRLDWIRAQMPRAFKTLVNPNMEVKRLPPEEEPGAPAAYGGAGSIDGKIPGRFWINLRTTDLHRKYDLPDLAFHEAIPGHIWQGEYTHQMPLIRQMLAFNAYSEGWALYAEQLADELGAYEQDHVGRLGYLQSIAFRACRLVVDTGIHAKRWTREQGGRVLRRRERIESRRSRQRGRSLLLVARAGVRLQGGTQRDQPAARRGEDGARAELRPEGVQRHRRARRQRAARRAGEERRRNMCAPPANRRGGRWRSPAATFSRSSPRSRPLPRFRGRHGRGPMPIHWPARLRTTPPGSAAAAGAQRKSPPTRSTAAAPRARAWHAIDALSADRDGRGARGRWPETCAHAARSARRRARVRQGNLRHERPADDRLERRVGATVSGSASPRCSRGIANPGGRRSRPRQDGG